jgi:hypothetical protein
MKVHKSDGIWNMNRPMVKTAMDAELDERRGRSRRNGRSDGRE